MSLAITVESVHRILIDRWYAVVDDTFTVDAYEFIDPPDADLVAPDPHHHNPVLLHNGGAGFYCRVWKGADGLREEDHSPFDEATPLVGPVSGIRAIELHNEEEGK